MTVNSDELAMMLGVKDIEIYVLKKTIAEHEKTIEELKKQVVKTPEA